jgi:hypothetical protein
MSRTTGSPLEDFIRAAYAAHVPMVGICFGHQIIAQAMGGKVEKYAGGWSVGPTEYDFGDQSYRSTPGTRTRWCKSPRLRGPPQPPSARMRRCSTTTGCSSSPHPEFRKVHD